MERLVKSYDINTRVLRDRLRVKENFDVIERHLEVGGCDVCFFYIDGFVKDGEMLRIMQFLLSEKRIGTAEELERRIPYVEVELCRRTDKIIRAVLSGQSAMLSESFGGEAILLDLRTYPARDTAEPEGDRVMQGPRDGFVETLVMNTALIRRRIRDPRLTMEHFSMGGSSDTDVVMCFVEGVAREDEVKSIRERLNSVKPKSLTLGFQSLAELLIKKGWFNPFPKIRTTERPDTASAQLLEGSIIILCDTSPLAMILPTSIFDYLEESSDYYFPPLTGTYLRLVRTAILLLSVVITPLWYLALEYGEALPETLKFLIPESPGALPIILQLFLAEIAIDGLKIASMNTPDILSNSLSVVGALILGDFAVSVGWLCQDVILYMAFVAIANFAQQNYELGYAFKFVRMLTLALVWLLGVWGFVAGMLIFLLLVISNTTVPSERGYLYPLIPFSLKGILHYLYRHPKKK
ncbi:MAG: spore germination protein [Clostridia bacterium]|nr:spore germination protein [Clostridia bacterium]